MSGNAAPPPPPPPPAGGPPPAGNYPAAGGAAAGQQNGMGTWSLVLGIVGLICCSTIIVPILAVIFGVMGRKKAAEGLASNGGMATAGLILGIIGIVLGVGAWIYSISTGNMYWNFNSN